MAKRLLERRFVINHFSCNWQGHLDTGDTYDKHYYYEALKKGK